MPIRKGVLGGKCYDRRAPDVGFYETTFIVGLRLPFSTLHHWLASYLGVSVNQIALNSWMIFIGAEVLWGQLSGGHRSLTLEEFFYCYKPQEIPRSKGFYNFVCRWAALRLIFDMPDSNRQWKARFFVQGVNWVCCPNEWDIKGSFYDHSWRQLNKSSEFSRLFESSVSTHYWTNSITINFFFLFCPSQSLPDDPS